MLMAGKKGHLAMADLLRSDLVTEFHVKETVRDACFMHNESFFAAAQKQYT